MRGIRVPSALTGYALGVLVLGGGIPILMFLPAPVSGFYAVALLGLAGLFFIGYPKYLGEGDLYVSVCAEIAERMGYPPVHHPWWWEDIHSFIRRRQSSRELWRGLISGATVAGLVALVSSSGGWINALAVAAPLFPIGTAYHFFDFERQERVRVLEQFVEDRAGQLGSLGIAEIEELTRERREELSRLGEAAHALRVGNREKVQEAIEEIGALNDRSLAVLEGVLDDQLRKESRRSLRVDVLMNGLFLIAGILVERFLLA